MTLDQLVEHVDRPGVDGDPSFDIRRLAPEITRDQALQVQLAAKRRRAAAGDRIVGHQASFTSFGIRKMFPDAPLPMVGTLLASLMRNDGDEVVLDADESFIECEIGMILKRDLQGRDLTEAEVLSAIDCFLPAIEVAPLRPGVREGAYSFEHLIAVQKQPGGYIVLGSRHTAAAGLDLVLEGCLVTVDGRPRGAATGYEAMGNPLKAVAAMAANLDRVGEKLCAGQVLITGSLPTPPVATRANRVARADFTRLGSVTVIFAGE